MSADTQCKIFEINLRWHRVRDTGYLTKFSRFYLITWFISTNGAAIHAKWHPVDLFESNSAYGLVMAVTMNVCQRYTFEQARSNKRE